MDQFIQDIIREYHQAFQHTISIGAIILGFVCICGMIRFGIAIRRRAMGIYPPAASQMEDH